MTGAVRGAPPAARAVCLAVLACAIGFACGQAVRPRPAAPGAAPAARDDGTGILARLSRAGEGGALGGAGYGSAGYGGASYGAQPGRATGGSIYANYQFEGYSPPAAGGATSPYVGDYRPGAANGGGTIEGQVLWPSPPRAPGRLPAGARCGAIANRTLQVGRGGAVANAVVWLEDIRSGRTLLGQVTPYPVSSRSHQLGGAIEWRGCAVHPHMQLVAPIGAVLEATSADGAVELTGTRVLGAERLSVFALELGVAGASGAVQLVREGLVEVAPRGGPAAGRGWIVLAGHPYHDISDEAGRFALHEVPPGSYTLVIWHEPVVLGVDGDGAPVTAPPVQVKRRVTVRARQVQRVTVKLPAAR